MNCVVLSGNITKDLELKKANDTSVVSFAIGVTGSKEPNFVNIVAFGKVAENVATAEAGFVMLGNITLDEKNEPVYNDEGIFKEIPNFLQETAFIDRIHGIIPGWKMPRISKDTPSSFLGFKGDFFSEILHSLRSDVYYTDYVNLNMKIENCNDLRDRKAITRLATGYLKILFPDLKLSNSEFNKYCVKPAVELRQRVRDELYKMDKEYKRVLIKVSEG